MKSRDGILDLSDYVALRLNGNKIPEALLSVCQISVCPSAKDILSPDDLFNFAHALIAGVIEQIVSLWNNDENFRAMVSCLFIANSQLDTLCDMKKHMN